MAENTERDRRRMSVVQKRFQVLDSAYGLSTQQDIRAGQILNQKEDDHPERGIQIEKGS